MIMSLGYPSLATTRHGTQAMCENHLKWTTLTVGNLDPDPGVVPGTAGGQDPPPSLLTWQAHRKPGGPRERRQRCGGDAAG